jgi:hypothetical protein
MRVRRVVAVMMALAGLCSAGSRPARAQVTGENPARQPVMPPDSSYAPRYRFTPVFNNKISADVSSVGMSNEFRTGMVTPWGFLVDFMLMGDEKNYRLQNRLEENKRMSLSALHTFRPGLFGSASYSDTRVFNRSIAVGGGVQDFIINDQVVAMGGTYQKSYENLRMDWAGSGNAVNGERTFKTDDALAAGVNGGLGYNVLDGRIVVQGRGALRGSRESSSTVDSTFTGLGSSEDSLMTAVRVQFADSIKFDATYRAYNGERTFADQGRGSLGGQTGGAENIFEETETRDSRITTLTLNANPFKRFGLKLSAYHDEQAFDYQLENTRDNLTNVDAMSGTVSYTTPWQTVATVTFENSSTDRELFSISSVVDKRRRAAVALSHRFTQTLQADFNASSQIQQSFYKRYDENPRDRDQVDTNLNLRISSSPFKRVSANVTLAYSISDFINIDASQSENNRTRELYEMRPGFTWVLSEMFTISQTYGIAIEYTDYTYNPNQNFLDRNLTFSNEFQFRPTKRIDLRWEYALHLHDSGSYLPDEVTGERLLDVDSEDRRDRMRIRMDFKATNNIKIYAENVYSQREDRTPGSDDVSVNTDGSVMVGTNTEYDWGNGRKLKFLVGRVKRFSEFGAEAEKNYWDARSEFSYPF